MHYRAYVIFTDQVGLVDIFDIKIAFAFAFDVFVYDLNMFASVWPRMLMPESNGMHQLVYHSE